jgi:carbon monoxide dehydrogenase subunit G
MAWHAMEPPGRRLEMQEMIKALYNLLLAMAISALLHSTADAGPAYDQGIGIAVEARGDLVIVDVNFTVPVTPGEAWMVLTDYDHMQDFLPNVQSSKIVESAGNKVHVAQQGKAYYGPLSFSYHLVQEVALKPYTQMRSHAIGGSIKKADGFTQLIPEGSGTRIVYHSESDPNLHLPRGIKQSFAAKATREHFENIKKEIMRRKIRAQK